MVEDGITPNTRCPFYTRGFCVYARISSIKYKLKCDKTNMLKCNYYIEHNEERGERYLLRNLNKFKETIE